jgi:flagellar biosynthesis/type III secretory pathway protein FliH
MISLFDEEQIMDIFIKDMTRKAREEGRKEGIEEVRKEVREEGRKEGREEGRKEVQVETAKILIKGGKLTLDEISECTPSLTMEELEQIEAEVMNLT